MSTLQLRKRIKKRFDALPPDRLGAADDYLAYLLEREASDELLRVPGMMRRVRAAESALASGRARNWRSVRSEV